MIRSGAECTVYFAPVAKAIRKQSLLNDRPSFAFQVDSKLFKREGPGNFWKLPRELMTQVEGRMSGGEGPVIDSFHHKEKTTLQLSGRPTQVSLGHLPLLPSLGGVACL